MMKLNTLAAAMAITVMTTACSQSDNQPKIVATGEVVATVNGKPISKAAFQILADEVNARRGENKVPDDKIVDELIKRELLAQDLLVSDAAKDPKIAAKIENAERMMLSQAAAESFLETSEATDDELKKEYDDRVGAMQRVEFRARHILVDAEDQAKDIIAKLAKGEKFEALAKKFSKDPGSKDKGGELGWFSPQQMVEPFAKAVVALKDGETTQSPVQSQFGWHVITREESRTQDAPPFDAVKEQLKGLVQTKKLQERINALMAKAKIDRKAPAAPAPAKDAAPNAAAPAAAPAPAAP
jgi:peptidyl-prolyl cis-trans isomerase C